MQIPKGEIVATADQRVVMHGVSWDSYERFLEIRGDRSMPRMVYLDGALELMTTSEDHEDIKNRISRLLEVYMLETGMDFCAYGQWTMRRKERETGIESDECYRIGLDQTRGRFPDLAIEVVWTHGGLDKLEAYQRIGVREVWFWRDGAIEVHFLSAHGYEQATHSIVVPRIDLGELATFVKSPLLSDAIRAYAAALRDRVVP